MEIQDAAGVRWEITRRFAPWKRVIQPVAIALGEYQRYAVVRPEPGRRALRDRTKERRQRHKASRESTVDKVWGSLHLSLKILLFPFLLIALIVVGYTAEVLEAIFRFGQLLLMLLLSPFALVENLLRLLAGTGLWLFRLIGAARTRVDVVGREKGQSRIGSLTVLTVSGFSRGGVLRDRLGAARGQARAPFDPHRDPALIRELTSAGARVERHDSGWTAPSQVPAFR